MKHKILLVDDQENILKGCKEFLESSGYTALTALTKAEAMAQIKDHADSLVMIVCDYNLGEETGFDIRQEMLPSLRHVPFSILSGYLTKELALQGIDLSICAFIEKPCSMESLLAIIEDKSSSRKEEIREELEMIQEFQEDVQSLLEDIESGILELESNGGKLETIDNIMRLLHTIKGTSACLSLSSIAQLAHRYEDFFGPLKRHEVPVTQSITSILLKAYDLLKSQIADIEKSKRQPISAEFLDQLFVIDIQKIQQEHQEQTKAKASGDSANSHSSIEKEEEVSVSMSLLNEFMEQSGELTVLRSIIVKHVKSLEEVSGSSETLERLVEALDEMHNVSAAIQSKIVEIRKVPLKNTLKQLPRVVRDASKSTGKQVDLQFSGQELRIDHTISQALVKSLVHVIRNSIDHGIESPQKRTELNKSSTGQVSVNCSQSGDEVIVEIVDDGQGIDPDRVKAKALQNGLFTEQQLNSFSKQKIQTLIFEPGFSTAEKVTDLSGRGVGMDMVRTSVEELGGSLKLDSEVGRGTHLTMRFPTPKSVLIIKSLYVKVGCDTFAVNQDDIVRVLSLDSDRAKKALRSVGQQRFLTFEGRLLPVLELAREIGAGDPEVPSATANFVVLKSERCWFVLPVDQVLDNEEIVVKPLTFNYGEHKLFAGATFLGDGQIALVLDCKALCDHYKTNGNDHSTQEKVESEIALEATALKSYLLVKDSGRHQAIDLSEVYRLEKFKTSQLEAIGKETIIRYQESPLYIRSICSESSIQLNDDLINVVVYKRSDMFFGLMVENIADIIMDHPVPPVDRPFGENVIGGILHEEKVFGLIDLDQITERLSPYIISKAKAA